MIYLASELGKHGVPIPIASDQAVLRNIMRYIHSPTMSFAYVGGKFIVYDATNGRCDGPPDYWVLNSPWCADGYAPTDRPNSTVPMGTCDKSMHRPWMQNDGFPPQIPMSKMRYPSKAPAVLPKP